MKKLLVILFCALLLSAYASPYEVQVPMSGRQQTSYRVLTTSSARVHSLGGGDAYRPSQAVIRMNYTVRPTNTASVPAGRFSTYVPAMNASGRAVLVAEESNRGPHVRRVGHDDDEDDPFMGKVDPVGDIPWWLFVLLAVGYGAYRRRFSKA